MKTQKRKTIELALQGGGAHGALTWGVLDRLLEDDRLHIQGMPGPCVAAFYRPSLCVVLSHGFTQEPIALPFVDRLGHIASFRGISPARKSEKRTRNGVKSSLMITDPNTTFTMISEKEVVSNIVLASSTKPTVTPAFGNSA